MINRRQLFAGLGAVGGGMMVGGKESAADTTERFAGWAVTQNGCGCLALVSKVNGQTILTETVNLRYNRFVILNELFNDESWINSMRAVFVDGTGINAFPAMDLANRFPDKVRAVQKTERLNRIGELVLREQDFSKDSHGVPVVPGSEHAIFLALLASMDAPTQWIMLKSRATVVGTLYS